MNTELINTEIIHKYEEFVNPAVAKLFRFMGLTTVEWRAEGTKIVDNKGNSYIDCLGGYGVFSLGHRNNKVIEAVKQQLEFMPLASKVFLNKQMADLSEVLANITPGDMKYSFIVNSGTEAVEGAIKLARIHSGRNKIVSTINSFHGKTLGALSATGRDIFRDPFKPLLGGFVHVPFNCIASMEQAIDTQTAAVIVEPIQGEGGIITPSENYLPTIRSLCDKAGALLICDEVQTGLGRTGAMFAVDHYNVIPDIITMAKALGGGVMPIGAFTARASVWQKYIDNPFLHTSTFGGNPLACAAALAAIRVITEENLTQRAADVGNYFVSALKKLGDKFPTVLKEVRGKGLMIGLEFTKEGLGGFIMTELINGGVLVAYTLNNPKVIRIEPPLIISYEEVDTVLKTLDKVLSKAAEIVDDI